MSFIYLFHKKDYVKAQNNIARARLMQSGENFDSALSIFPGLDDDLYTENEQVNHYDFNGLDNSSPVAP